MSDLVSKLSTLNAEYARCIDDDRLEAWPDFFVEQCLYRITSVDNHARGMQAGLIYADTCARRASTSASATAISSGRVP